MPLFYFQCPVCKELVKKLLSVQNSKKEYNCPNCKEILFRNYQNPSTIIKETIDNGIQQRKVEQFADSNQLLEEREAQAKIDKHKKEL